MILSGYTPGLLPFRYLRCAIYHTPLPAATVTTAVPALLPAHSLPRLFCIVRFRLDSPVVLTYDSAPSAIPFSSAPPHHPRQITFKQHVNLPPLAPALTGSGHTTPI